MGVWVLGPRRRKDELVQALQEISVEDRKRRLANSKGDLGAAERRIKQINRELDDAERRLQASLRTEKTLKLDLDKWRNKVSTIELAFPLTL
jgi:predicted  nucleic acid-binding Zn-ribbon protein